MNINTNLRVDVTWMKYDLPSFHQSADSDDLIKLDIHFTTNEKNNVRFCFKQHFAY